MHMGMPSWGLSHLQTQALGAYDIECRNISSTDRYLIFLTHIVRGDSRTRRLQLLR